MLQVRSLRLQLARKLFEPACYTFPSRFVPWRQRRWCHHCRGKLSRPFFFKCALVGGRNVLCHQQQSATEVLKQGNCFILVDSCTLVKGTLSKFPQTHCRAPSVGSISDQEGAAAAPGGNAGSASVVRACSGGGYKCPSGVAESHHTHHMGPIYFICWLIFRPPFGVEFGPSQVPFSTPFVLEIHPKWCWQLAGLIFHGFGSIF